MPSNIETFHHQLKNGYNVKHYCPVCFWTNGNEGRFCPYAHGPFVPYEEFLRGV